MFKNNKPLKIINSIKILYKISMNWFFDNYYNNK